MLQEMIAEYKEVLAGITKVIWHLIVWIMNSATAVYTKLSYKMLTVQFLEGLSRTHALESGCAGKSALGSFSPPWERYLYIRYMAKPLCYLGPFIISLFQHSS